MPKVLPDIPLAMLCTPVLVSPVTRKKAVARNVRVTETAPSVCMQGTGAFLQFETLS